LIFNSITRPCFLRQYGADRAGGRSYRRAILSQAIDSIKQSPDRCGSSAIGLTRRLPNGSPCRAWLGGFTALGLELDLLQTAVLNLLVYCKSIDSYLQCLYFAYHKDWLIDPGLSTKAMNYRSRT
jgi:hypothetical protein